MIKESPLQQILLKLKSVFPEAVTETKQVDDDGRPYYIYALKEEFIRQLQEAGLDMADDQNRYELQFPGKQTAKAAVFTPCHKTLAADRKQSKNFDDTGNVFIEGDNLDALRMLQKSYRGKVKVIYIDPPYNTGSDNFVYNDDFSVKQKAYLQAAGVLDEDGVRQISEIQTGLKGRFHAGWLAFMYPRLKLARELLTDDGVIFISIDDNEQANLKLICDEVFGEENFVADFMWNSTKSITNPALVSVAHTHNLTYTKALDVLHNKRSQFRLAPILEGFSNPDNDARGPWKADPFEAGGERPNQMYPITNPDTGAVFYPKKGNCWKNDLKKFKILLADNRIVFGKNGKSRPQRKRFLSEAKTRGLTPNTWWDDVGTTTNGTMELNLLLGDNKFDNPKPTTLIRKILKLATDKTAIVLDFFAGSATTAHAVMQLNAEDGGNRKFILVQLPEMIDPKKSKEAHEFCTDELKRPSTIAEIAKERIRRAGAQLATESPITDIDAGFRAFVIQNSLLSNREEQPFARTSQTDLQRYAIKLKPEEFVPILYETLLKTGTPLHLPIITDKIENYPFAICDRRCYCVTENLSQKIVQAITDKHGESFDILYYLSDALNATTSFTEIEAVIHQAPSSKQVQGLAFY